MHSLHCTRWSIVNLFSYLLFVCVISFLALFSLHKFYFLKRKKAILFFVMRHFSFRQSTFGDKLPSSIMFVPYIQKWMSTWKLGCHRILLFKNGSHAFDRSTHADIFDLPSPPILLSFTHLLVLNKLPTILISPKLLV